MSLKNLKELAEKSQEEFLNYNKEEVILTPDFKAKYTEYFHSNSGDNISFAKYTTLVETSGGLTITFPNQWFYIASYFIEYLVALKEYKSIYTSVLKPEKDVKELIKRIKETGTIDNNISQKIETALEEENDILFFRTFLCDYSWWYGNKTIDRGDYFESPILSLAKVVNVTQSYIAKLAENLAKKPELLRLLKNSKLSTFLPQRIGPLVNEEFDFIKFYNDCKTSGLTYSNQLVTRYISSLVTKPFVLLSGLSGSGKTKLVQSFAQWICGDVSQYCIVPVGADWINREPLLGYANALDNREYILPENGALKLMIEANKEENQNKPYFLILDEMNLSHVERYFADFLSIMESKDTFKLHSSIANLNITEGEKFSDTIEVPNELGWPQNLFVVGTVNIDETTYMFSPKVLDRANVIEFRIKETEILSFLENPIEIKSLNGEGANMAESFVQIAKDKSQNKSAALTETLYKFFKELQKIGAEFGYRTASEIQTLFSQIDIINKEYSGKENDKIDIAIMQKLLPKLHGSRRKLIKPLTLLAQLCLEKEQENLFNEKGNSTVAKDNQIKYPLSFEKISRMYGNLIENGFTSYAEA